eukprot:gene8118-10994_t
MSKASKAAVAEDAFNRIQSLLTEPELVTNKSFNSGVNNDKYQYDYQQSAVQNFVGLEGQSDINITAEKFLSDIHPDEKYFHDILHKLSHQKQEEQNHITGKYCSDNIQHAEIASCYAKSIQQRYVDNKTKLRQEMLKVVHSIKAKSQQIDSTSQEIASLKAERDLWSLLEILSWANLLDDINEDECEDKFMQAMNALNLNSSIPDYINAVLANDNRVKKGAILKEWIEKAAADSVVECPVPKAEPWSDTMQRINREKRSNPSRTDKNNSQSKMQSIHPDAQLTKEGFLLSLDGSDQLDQELILKSIWQLIRSGQLESAQKTAYDHRLYWLAASLKGQDSHHYETMATEVDENDENNNTVQSLVRIGNLKQPIWMKTCWKYSQILSKNPNNWKLNTKDNSNNNNIFDLSKTYNINNKSSANSIGILEMSIYAALSNNIQVLNSSPLINSWHDKVWVYLKATHERDLLRVIHKYRCIKQNHSIYYPGCDMKVISSERELLDMSKHNLSNLSTSNCIQIFQKVPIHINYNNYNNTTTNNWDNHTTKNDNNNEVENIILKLQASVIEGKASIISFIGEIMLPILLNSDHTNIHSILLRLFCHFCLWLKYSPSNTKNNQLLFSQKKNVCDYDLSDLIADEVLYLSIEKYVDYLIIVRKQYSLVATYVVFLSRPLRIKKYVELMQFIQLQQTKTTINNKSNNNNLYNNNVSLEINSTHDEVSVNILLLAKQFFPQDVLDITRAVVESNNNNKVDNNNQNVINNSIRKQAKAVSFYLNDTPFKIANVDSNNRSPSLFGSPIPHNATTTPQTNSYYKSTSRHISTPLTRNNNSNNNMSLLITENEQELLLDSIPIYADNLYTRGGSALKNTPIRTHNTSPSKSILFSSKNNHENNHIINHNNPMDDMKRMETLKWLFIDQTHRIEAIKQTNRLITSFLLEGYGLVKDINNNNNEEFLSNPKIISIQKVIDVYLPIDSIQIAISNTVIECKQHLHAMRDTSLAMSILLSLLLKKYLKVCLVTADVLETLQLPQESIKWYQKGIKLADLVASEQVSLQLYTILPRDDLESIIQDINKLAIRLLKLDPTFPIE